MLTASGGPFRGRTPRRAGRGDRRSEALAHPTWDMGPVVTINSANLVNKGLEVIEAHLLFGIPYDRIEVVVHPTSRSCTRWWSSSTARRWSQASPPTMLIPIALGLGLARPGARHRAAGRLDAGPTPGSSSRSTTRRSRPCGWPARRGSAARTAPAVYNAANEVVRRGVPAGPAARSSRSSTRLPGCWGTTTYPRMQTLTVDDVLAADAWARDEAARLIERSRPHDTPCSTSSGSCSSCSRSWPRSGCTSSATWSRRRRSAGRSRSTSSASAPPSGAGKRGETEYGVKAIPLGGYVKIVGMLPPDKEHADKVEYDDDGNRVVTVRKSNTGLFAQLISDARAAEWETITADDEDRLFYRMAWWKKVIVMAGGPTVNLMIAFVIFAGLFATYGNPADEVAAPDGRRGRGLRRPGRRGRPCLHGRPTRSAPAAEAGLPGRRPVRVVQRHAGRRAGTRCRP